MTVIPSFMKLKFSDPVKSETLQRMQRNVAATLDPLAASQLLGYKIATLTIATSQAAEAVLALGHGLGRVPQGIIPLVSADGPTGFVTSSAVNASPTMVTLLQCPIPLPKGATFSFLVF